MKEILSKIGMAIVVLFIILICLWVYPLSMKKDADGEYTCYNIFGHYVQCND